jgi:hypothetical protein
MLTFVNLPLARNGCRVQDRVAGNEGAEAAACDQEFRAPKEAKAHLMTNYPVTHFAPMNARRMWTMSIGRLLLSAADHPFGQTLSGSRPRRSAS